MIDDELATALAVGDETRACRIELELLTIFVKINGKRHYLWRVVDHEGEVLERFVTKTRDKKAALGFL